MAIGTPVSPTPAVGASATTVASASFTPTADALLFAWSAGRGALAVPPTVTDSLGSTWNLIPSSDIDAGNVVGALYWMDTGGSPAARTVTADSSGGTQTVLVLVEVTGAGTSDFSNFKFDTDTAGDPSVTMDAFETDSACLFFGVGNGGGTWTQPTNYTRVISNETAANTRFTWGYDLNAATPGIAPTSTSTDSILLGIEVKLPAAGGAIAGSASVAFTGAGTLRGAGRLSGSAAATFTNTGNLRGLAPITGSASMAFTTSGDGILIGFLTGTSNLAFTTDGTLLGTGALTASIFPQFTVSGHMVSESFITGSAAVAFTTSGTLRGVGRLTGTSALTFTTAGITDVPDSLFGSSLLTFTPSGTLRGTGRLTGSCSLTFTPTGVGTRNKFATGSAHLTFTVSGDGERIFAPYEVTSGTSPDDIFGTGSGTGLFLYFETSGTGPDEIYEEN